MAAALTLTQELVLELLSPILPKGTVTDSFEAACNCYLLPPVDSKTVHKCNFGVGDLTSTTFFILKPTVVGGGEQGTIRLCSDACTKLLL